MSEQKQRVIKFAPLTTAPAPVDPASIACKIEDYNALTKQGFYVLHQSQSLVTFTKNFPLKDGLTCNTNFRFEKDVWQCTIMLQFDKRSQVYETFYSAKYKELTELLDKITTTFDIIKEFAHSLANNTKDLLAR